MNAATLPLYMHDVFGFPTALVLGTLLGFAFGFVLERAGFGRASVLAAQFYFSDTRVLKVMFSAIVTALLGIVVLAGIGFLDMAAMTIPPTFIWPQIAGGLLLGVGFIVSGYCPGTSVVAAASGKLDGLMTVFGVVAGSLAFGFGYDALSGFYTSGAMGEVRLPDLLGVDQSLLAAAVVLMAVGAFVGAERLEGVMAKKRGEPQPPGSFRIRRRVFQGFAAATGLGMAAILIPAHQPLPEAKTFTPIEAVELAELIVENPHGVYLVDARGTEACREVRIPGALCLPEGDPRGAFLADFPETRTLILYGSNTLEALPPGAEGFPGRIRVLSGGYAAFEEAVLRPPALPANPTAADITTFRLRSALHAHFAGVEIEAAPAPAPRKIQRVTKKRGGGC